MKLPHSLSLVTTAALLAISAVSVSAFAPIATNGLDSNQQATVAPLNVELLADEPTELNVTLDDISRPQLLEALNQISPEKFGYFTSTLAFNNAVFEVQAMDTYLASYRQGDHGTFVQNGGIDVSGLSVNDPNVDPALQVEHSHMFAWNTPSLRDGLMSDSSESAVGGVDTKDSKDMKSMSAPEYGDPWHFFVRGNVVLGQGLSQQDVSHFDYNTSWVVVGTDYRIDPNWMVGLTGSFAHTDVTLDNNGSSATVDSYSPGLYASYANQGWYANVIGDYLHNAYTQDRHAAVFGDTASSAPEGNEGVADFDGGYEFHLGKLTAGPLAGVEYTHLSVDGYGESGSITDLTVQGQQADSLRGRVGGRASYAMSCGGITFTPHLEAAYQHEFMDQSRGINSAFNEGGGDFSVRTPNPSRDSVIVDAGADAALSRTVGLFLDYDAQAGQSDYFGQSVQGGVKFGF